MSIHTWNIQLKVQWNQCRVAIVKLKLCFKFRFLLETNLNFYIAPIAITDEVTKVVFTSLADLSDFLTFTILYLAMRFLSTVIQRDRQTVQTHIRRRTTWHLIWVYTICIHNFYSMLHYIKKSTPDTLKIGNRPIDKNGESPRQIRINNLRTGSQSQTFFSGDNFSKM